ncbi:MAG: hypothetical protein PVF05_13390 [Gemmatimonadales bacterium]|jgi:hypothetical protein
MMLKRLLTGSALGLVALSAAIAAIPRPAAAQVALDEENRVDLVLDDGTNVTLLGAAKGIGDRSTTVDYYYLPTGLRLSKGADGRPQFLLMNYRNEAGDVSGGVLHFLMEWGLTQAQLEEANDKLGDVCTEGAPPRQLDAPQLEETLNAEIQAMRSGVAANLGAARQAPELPGSSQVEGLWPVKGQIPCGTIRGAARVSTDGEGESFRVISATLTSDAMTRSLVSSGKAPVLPGNRIAVAADMSANGAQLLAAPFERDMPIGDLSLQLDLSFTSRVPAGEGRIVMHWDRLTEQGSELERTWNKRQQREETAYRRKCWIGKRIFAPRTCDVEEISRKKKYVSDVEMRDFYSFLIEQNVIELDFRENVADERLAPVREAFFQYFLSSFAEPVSADEMTALRGEDDSSNDELEINQNKRRYYRSRTTRSVAQGQKTQEFKLNYHLAYERPFSVVQNIKSWYDDVVANYPESLADVYLNDPFFHNQTVRFRLDFDAPQDLFSAPADATQRASAINYVTVKIKKDRPDAGEFTDAAVIDEDYIAENGLFAQFTFGADQSGDDSFQYMTQWSFGGGNVYPKTEQWQTASSPAVTLAPPVTPRTIEVEGDLSDMEASDVSRINVQVAYRKFGEASVENIPVSPAQGEPLVSRTIFMDRDQNGYAYRLIVYRKTGDRIATEWAAKNNDNYVYAAVPSDILQNPDLLEQAKSAASDAAGQAVESAANAALEKFRGVLEGGN